MKTLFFSILVLCVGLIPVFAQDGIKITDVECYNLGDGRYYCHERKSKKPLEGSMRMIDGVTSQYIEAVFKKGIPDGSWKLYKYNVLAEEYTYKEGIMHGDHIQYYSDGATKAYHHFVDGKAEGKCVTYYTNGMVESEIHFKNGEQDGMEVYYDTDGNIRSSIAYAAGRKTGPRKELVKSNTGDYELTAFYKEGKYDGDYSEIYTNGNVKVTGHYIDGKKDGTWETGKRDGNKIRTEVYENDDKINETIYYTDGSVEVTRELKNGKKNGWERTYNFREGTLKSELFYKDGQVSSDTGNTGIASGNSAGLAKQTKQLSSSYGIFIQTFYQNNGKYEGEYTEQWVEGDKAVKTKGQYENGKKTGLWVYMNPFGEKEKEESFTNDKLEGKQTFYESNGKVAKFYNYKNDVKDGEYAIYREDRLYEKGTYVNDRIEGVQTIYYANGNPQNEYTIPHNPNGERIEKDYTQTGHLRFERRYEGGRQVGEKQYYDEGKLRRVLQRNEEGRLVTVEEYDASGKKIN